MLDIARLSRRYDVRRMREADADDILALCKQNAQFYRYCAAEATRAQVLSDLRVGPPGKALSDKYYVGFYEAGALVAVMDLIDGYPEADVAFVGFFMVNPALQGQGIGSGIVGEAFGYLREAGFRAVRLAIDRDNPQSNHFWKKNGFEVLKSVDREGWTVLVAERAL